jgi:WD40 repeat protein
VTLRRVRLLNHGAAITDAVFARRGNWVATGGADAKVVLWSSRDGGVLHQWLLPARIAGVAVSADGAFMACGSGGEVHVFAVESGHLQAVLPAPRVGATRGSGVRAVRFSPTGDLLAVADPGRTVSLWSVGAWRLDRTLQLGGTALQNMPLAGVLGVPTSVSFTLDGRFLAAGLTKGGARVWDLRTGGSHVVSDAKLYVCSVDDVTLTADGSLLAMGCSDGTTRLFDPGPPARTRDLKGSTGVRRLSCSPDGRYVVTAGADGAVRLWDIERGTALAYETVRPTVGALEFSENGKGILAAGGDGIVTLWAVETA